MKNNKYDYYDFLSSFFEFNNGYISFMNQHRITPLYYYHKDSKKNLILQIAIANKISRILDIIELLEKNKIKYIVLKGISCGMFYPSLYTRDFNDLDIYILKNEIPQVIKILKKKGFLEIKKDKHLDEVIIMINRKIPLSIEIHYKSIFFSTKFMFEESRIYSINSNGKEINFRALNTEALFLLLIVHLFYQHYFYEQRLIWWTDLIILKDNISIKKMFYILNQMKNKKAAFFGIYCLGKLDILKLNTQNFSLFYSLLWNFTKNKLFKIKRKKWYDKIMEELYQLSLVTELKGKLKIFIKKRAFRINTIFIYLKKLIKNGIIF